MLGEMGSVKDTSISLTVGFSYLLWAVSADHDATVKVRPTHLHAHAQLPGYISNARLGPGTHGKRHTMVVKMDHHLWPQRTVTIIIENNTRSMINHSYWRVTAFYFIIKW